LSKLKSGALLGILISGIPVPLIDEMDFSLYNSKRNIHSVLPGLLRMVNTLSKDVVTKRSEGLSLETTCSILPGCPDSHEVNDGFGSLFRYDWTR
jgi:hypothetical protein